MTESSTPAHGGRLIQRELTGKAREDALREAKDLPVFELRDYELSDIEMIASGAMPEGSLPASRRRSVGPTARFTPSSG
jgi:ATP sulfurylase